MDEIIDKMINDENKEHRSASIRLIDGKIICSYSLNKNDKYLNYEKVFDDWDEFTEYSKEFFKEKEEE